jgi:hypothetical protein
MHFDPGVRPHRGPIKTEDRRISDQQTLEEALGVSRSSFVSYHRECRTELARIESCLPAILSRHFRVSAQSMAETFDAIVRNIEGDPDDTRVENALPVIMRRAAAALEEYLTLASQHRPPALVQSRITEIETMIADGAKWLARVLERMRSNDGQGIEAKVQVLSAVFGGTLDAPPSMQINREESETDTARDER